MLLRILSTDNHLVPALLRVLLAAVMWPHGAQKVLGWFGGLGFQGTMDWMTRTQGIPAPLAFLAIAAEFLGPLALLLGLGGRIAALAIAGVMVVAALTVHWPQFFMNWNGTAPGEGYEYHLLALAVALVVIFQGSGALSVDAWLTERLAG